MRDGLRLNLVHADRRGPVEGGPRQSGALMSSMTSRNCAWVRHARRMPSDLFQALTQLFTEASAAVASRLRDAGYPTVVSARTPVIVRTDNGWRGGDVPAQRNILAEDSNVLLGLAPLLSPGEIARMEECASLAASAYGSTLPFESFYSSYPLIESVFDQVGDPPTYDNDPIGWIARALIHPALMWHLTQLPDPAAPDDDAAPSFAADVLQFAADEELHYLRDFPLSGIDIRGLEHEAVTEGAVTIRKLSDSDQGKWLDESQHRRSIFGPIELPEVSLEIRMCGPRQGPSPQLELNELLVRTLSALQLHGYSPAGLTAALRRDPPWLAGGVWHTPFQIPAISAGSRKLDADDLSAVIATAGCLGRYERRTPRTPHDIALRRFATGATRPDAADALLDFTITLEALLLPDDPDARRTEMTYRFQMHGALYLANDAAGRHAVARQLRDIYGMRSRVVHGRSYPSPGELNAARDSARELASHGLLRAVHEGFPDADAFRQLILG
jgi:hypothetical protein